MCWRTRYAFAFLAKGEICQKLEGFISYRIVAKRQYIEFEQSENISNSSCVNIFHESEYIDRNKSKSKNKRRKSFYSCSFCRYTGLGLALLHLSGQMRHLYLAVFYKFSAKSLTLLRWSSFLYVELNKSVVVFVRKNVFQRRFCCLEVALVSWLVPECRNLCNSP